MEKITHPESSAQKPQAFQHNRIAEKTKIILCMNALIQPISGKNN